MSNAATDFRSEDAAWYLVKLTHPNHHKKIVFRSLSEARARNFIQNRFPRGEEVFLEHPDGRMESYSHERQGELGVEDDKWKEFDPNTWIPLDSQTPPGETMWADKEG